MSFNENALMFTCPSSANVHVSNSLEKRLRHECKCLSNFLSNNQFQLNCMQIVHILFVFNTIVINAVAFICLMSTIDKEYVPIDGLNRDDRFFIKYLNMTSCAVAMVACVLILSNELVIYFNQNTYNYNENKSSLTINHANAIKFLCYIISVFYLISFKLNLIIVYKLQFWSNPWFTVYLFLNLLQLVQIILFNVFEMKFAFSLVNEESYLMGFKLKSGTFFYIYGLKYYDIQTGYSIIHGLVLNHRTHNTYELNNCTENQYFAQNKCFLQQQHCTNTLQPHVLLVINQGQQLDEKFEDMFF